MPTDLPSAVTRATAALATCMRSQLESGGVQCCQCPQGRALQGQQRSNILYRRSRLVSSTTVPSLANLLEGLRYDRMHAHRTCTTMSGFRGRALEIQGTTNSSSATRKRFNVSSSDMGATHANGTRAVRKPLRVRIADACMHALQGL